MIVTLGVTKGCIDTLAPLGGGLPGLNGGRCTVHCRLDGSDVFYLETLQLTGDER